LKKCLTEGTAEVPERKTAEPLLGNLTGKLFGTENQLFGSAGFFRERKMPGKSRKMRISSAISKTGQARIRTETGRCVKEERSFHGSGKKDCMSYSEEERK
jgi:hypothetical protein